MFPRTYPSYPQDLSRSEREQAINAVEGFRDQARDLVEALPEEYSGFGEEYDALCTRLHLTSYAGAHLASAIAQAAESHGLVFYDPQTDKLILQTLLDSKKIGQTDRRTEPPTTLEEQGTIIKLGPWTVLAYPEATRRYYKKIEESGASRCGCGNCQNFVQARSQAIPPEIMTAFDSLGVDWTKESEVHYYGRTPMGSHTYRGWLYFAGSIQHGPESWHYPPKGKPERRFHQIGPHFEIGLGKKLKYGFSEWETVLIVAGSSDGPCVEVDFYGCEREFDWLDVCASLRA